MSESLPLIDTHVHLDDDRFDVDRDDIVRRATDCGVHTMVMPATTRARWSKLQTIANRYPNVLPAIGLHPMFLSDHKESDINALEAQLSASDRSTSEQSAQWIAVGECGLDRFALKQAATEQAEQFTKQIVYFEAQLNAAAKFGLPVIVHARSAVEDVIRSIKACGTTQGVVHSYNGSLQQAERLIDLGYRLGFGGAATNLRARKLHQLIQSIPLQSLLLETDAPDQTGHAHRGQRNEPAYLPEVLQTVASLRNTDVETVAQQCNQNAAELFGL